MPSFAADAGWTIALVALVTLGCSLAAPVYGLLLTAAVAPLGSAIGQAIGQTRVSIEETVVLAFLAGCLVRRLPDRRGPRVVAPAVAWLIAAALVARLGVLGGVRAAEGLGLAAATTLLFRRNPELAVTLPGVMAVSAVAALLVRVLLGRGDPAAGGYFAMIGCLALGMAVREDGSRRAFWWGMAAASGVGLGLSEWRGAMAGGADAGGPGVVVLGLLAVWIGAGVVRTARALLSAPRDARLAGAAAGLLAFLAFLATRLGGHLLLAGGAAHVFWIQFGLVTALAGSTLMNQAAAAD